MKKRFLRFYDKVIIVAIMGILALFGCNRKTYPEKETTPEKETKDTVVIDKKPQFDNEVIAMYGVRPTHKLD